MDKFIGLDWIPFSEALGWTLVHSLWQIALIGLALRLVLLFVPSRHSQIRYYLLLAGLGLMVCWVGVTFSSEWQVERPAVYIAQHSSPAELDQELGSMDRPHSGPSWGLESPVPPQADEVEVWTQVLPLLRKRLSPYLGWIVLAWYAGVMLFVLWMLIGYVQLRQLKRNHIQVPSDYWQQQFDRLKTQMGLRRSIQFSLSTAIQEPITFHFIKPIVLVPVGVISGLSPDQVETLLLHELAHIRRYDYLINAIQSVIEALFFYHPVIWWMSGKIRTEREHACDDWVLRVSQQPMVYAEALTQLQHLFHPRKTHLAMTAIGNHNAFHTRIFRLFGENDPQISVFKGSVMAFLLLVGLLGQSFLSPHSTTIPEPETPESTWVAPILDPTEPLSHEEVLPKPDLLSERAVDKDKDKNKDKQKDKDKEKEKAKEKEGDESMQISPEVLGNGSSWELLMTAIHDGNEELVKWLIEKGAEVNGQDGEGRTPLIEAAHHHEYDIARLLIQSGAQVNLGAYDGFTPLIEASEHGVNPLVKLLVEKGAEVNHASDNGHTALMVAAEHGHYEITQYLLEQGADPTAESLGWSVLKHAIHGGNVQIVSLIHAHLKELGDTDALNNLRESNLSQGLAVDPSPEVAAELIQAHKAGTSDDFIDCKPLLIAVKNENISRVRELLQSVDPDCEYRGAGEPRTPLVAAARLGNLEIAQLLLEAGASTEYHARGDESPLMAAAQHGHLELARYLVGKGADVNKIVRGDGTALLVAAKNGHTEVVRFLLNQKAEVNAQVPGDGTALINAARNGHYEVAKLLLESGADPFQVVPGDEYAMYHARAQGNKAMIKLLKEYEDK